MPLYLKAIAYKGAPIVEDISAEFGQQGGSIGRKAGNGLVLPDNESIVSSRHAEIVYQNGGYQIKDHSTNGTILITSGVTLSNNEAPLQTGEVLRIGEYDVAVTVIADTFPNINLTFDRPLEPLAEPTPPPQPLPSDLPQQDFQPTFSTPAFDPFAGTTPMFGDNASFKEQAPSSPFHDSFTPPDVSFAPPPSDDISAMLKGLDALSGLGSVVSVAAQPTMSPAFEPAPPIEPFAAPAEPPAGDFLQSLSALSSTAESPAVPSAALEGLDALANFASTAEPTPSINQQSEADEFLKSLATNDVAQSLTPAPETVTPAFIAEPTKAEPVKPAEPTVTYITPAPPAASDAELFKLFLQGAGISDPSFLSAEQWPQSMQSLGALFRNLVEGLMDVLRARAEMKSEFRVSVTTIRSFDNNPLKFNPDVESVLKLLLAPKNPAFIDANTAVKEAYSDLKYHQLAMTAGIQASVSEILRNFDPEAIEQSLGEGLVFQKKARCWEILCERYPELKTRAQEEFFGDAFAEAYEKQMRLLGRR